MGRFFILLLFHVMVNPLAAQQKVHVLVITGGHDYDTSAFNRMWDEMPGMSWELVVQPIANQWIAAGRLERFGALVFYDMYDSISSDEQMGYVNLVKQKKPMIFLHHSLASYQRWPEFKEIVGGRYHTLDGQRVSNYHHDQWMNIFINNPKHPVTSGLQNYRIFDETYGQVEIRPDIQPLLTTDHPLSMPTVGWINSYQGHDIIYLQGGHGPEAFKDHNFRQILAQTIRWSVYRR